MASVNNRRVHMRRAIVIAVSRLLLGGAVVALTVMLIVFRRFRSGKMNRRSTKGPPADSDVRPIQSESNARKMHLIVGGDIAPVILVNNSETASSAYESLSWPPLLFLDCKGHLLGCAEGGLRLIAVSAHKSRLVYLFDVKALERADLQPLLDLLADARIEKVMWDGRMDCIELRRAFGIRLERVMDLQVADLMARLGNTVRHPNKGLNVHKGHGLWHVKKLDIEGVYWVKSLKTWRGSSSIRYSFTDKRKPPVNLPRDGWLLDPLPEEYLKNAAHGIHLLASFLEDYDSRRFIDRPSRPDIDELYAASARYVHMYDAPLPAWSMYLQSNLMPLEILDAPSLDQDGPTDSEKTQCDKCARMLTPASFTYRDGFVRGKEILNANSKKKKVPADTDTGTGIGIDAEGNPDPPAVEVALPTVHASCKVCYLLDERAKVRQLRQKEEEKWPKRMMGRASASSTATGVEVSEPSTEAAPPPAAASLPEPEARVAPLPVAPPPTPVLPPARIKFGPGGYLDFVPGMDPQEFRAFYLQRAF